MTTLAVIHLVREPEGWQPFIDSYRKHPAGIEHDLVLAIKPMAVDLPEIPEPHTELFIPDRGFDLSAYWLAAKQHQADYYCFLNSWSVILADNWLAKLYAVASRPSVGLTGCTGSWESFYNANRSGLNKAHFPQFPNAHIRTNAFMLRRDVMEQVWERPFTKRGAYRFEHGKDSLTRRVMAMGLLPVVVDRRGCSWGKDDWVWSGTYRSQDQPCLLISDNQTRAWQVASREEQAELGRRAWGI